ncbi:hypothetical protein GCM10010348_12560 [Streptomyces anthocyanicus]|nr:hypothetical protein GCM10010348_12560 [Streptomyces anthocyanicus]
MSTAASVPICVIAVKAAPGSCQPENAAVSRRCALEDTGRNSVSPWTSPRTRDSNQDMELRQSKWRSENGGERSADTPNRRVR